MVTDEELKCKIKEIWAKSEDWIETPTSEEGICLVKFPIKPATQLFIGLKIKKSQNSIKGFFLNSSKELNSIRNLLNSQELEYFINQIWKDDQVRKRISVLNEWDTLDSDIPGIFYTKMPLKGKEFGFPAIALNPTDEFGKKLKRKNLYLKNSEDLKIYRRIFNNVKIDRLMKIIEDVNSELSFEFRVAQSKIIKKFR